MIKVMIREDREANVVRAFLATADGGTKVEVATIAASLLDRHPWAFGRWKALLQEVMVEAANGVLREVAPGAEVVGVREEVPARPHEGN